jgi:hypothetical protein
MDAAEREPARIPARHDTLGRFPREVAEAHEEPWPALRFRSWSDCPAGC